MIEEDNDLYGHIPEPGEKKATRRRTPCRNCGTPTSFANAKGDREKLGWCGPCFDQREKESFPDENVEGGRRYRNRSITRRTPFDGRLPKGE